MINWQTTKITPPPLIADMTLQELQQIEVSGSSEKREFQIPCHTQAVERIVKDVTRAAKSVCGQEEKRDIALSKQLF